MALHFDKAEYRARIDKVVSELAKERLDGLLMFNHKFIIRPIPFSYAKPHETGPISTWKPA